MITSPVMDWGSRPRCVSELCPIFPVDGLWIRHDSDHNKALEYNKNEWMDVDYIANHDVTNVLL